MKRIGAAILAAALLLALCGAGSAEQILLVDADLQTITLYEGGQKVKSWPCAVGKRGTPSPLGVWAVTQKQKNWGTGFGTRWIGFACPWGSFGIHGTNKPSSIGGQASHGCVRMLNRDVEELYARVRVGAKVVIERAAYGPLAAGLRSLAPGDRGADVLQLQLRLQNLGLYQGGLDGVFGEGLKRAVIAYRRENGLPVGDRADWALYETHGMSLFE